MRRIACMFATLGLASVAVIGRQATTSRHMVKTGTDYVSVDRPITDFTKDDFTISEHGEVRTIADVGTSAISGVVTDGHSGRPVTGALVQLSTVSQDRQTAPQTFPRQMTDSSGRFVFQRLAAGSYRLQATAPGYLDGGFGRVSGVVAALGAQITIQDRQWFRDANTVLWKPASIAGTIRDERGEPLVDVPVRILIAASVAGRDQWASGAVTQTDDRGAYRFAGLRAGRYAVQVPSMQITLPRGEVALYRSKKPDPLPVIRAADGMGVMAGYLAVPAGRGQVYPATFYPVARSVSAADVIDLDFGGQRSAADVSLVPVSSVRVSGIVVGPAAAIANLPVRLLAAGNELLGFGSETGLTRTDPTGRFTLAQVPQGDYTVLVGGALSEIQAAGAPFLESGVAPTAANPFLSGGMSRVSLGRESGLFLSTLTRGGDDVTGRVSISVGTDAIDGVVVPTRAGVTVSGHALFDGAEAPAAGRAIGRFGPKIGIEPADGDTRRTIGSSMNTATLPDSTFSIRNVVPGHYRLTDGMAEARPNGDYRLIGATWHGQDLFATPLDVTGEGPVTDIVVYLSSKKNAVSGVVRASNDKLSAGAVLIFPQDPARWREPGIVAPQFRTMDVSLTGAFSTENLIPGEYLIAAVRTEDRRRGLDIDFLKSLSPQATRITIDESSTLTMDLHIIGVRR
jgi:uncharacterized protein (DUF2141 family)